MKRAWSRLAVADRDAIFDQIERDNPAAAIAIDERIQHRLQRLLLFRIAAGQVASRAFVIGGTCHIAAYTIADQTIQILRVLHGAQLWPGAVA